MDTHIEIVKAIELLKLAKEILLRVEQLNPVNNERKHQDLHQQKNRKM